jgi:type I restriction enzyme S subunit
MMREVHNTLPAGWVKVTLGEVIEFKYGKSLLARKRDNIGYPVYGSNGEVGRHSVPLTQGPTLIVGRKGSIGKVHLSNDKCWPIDTTYYIDNLYGQPAEFWLYLLRSLRLSELNRATALPGLNRNDAYKLSLDVPPLNEQKRIVTRIGELQSRSRRAREALETVPDLLEQLRQSLLSAAFRGDLTKEWRKKNPGGEPASELLKRIHTERRKRWEGAELERLKAKGFAGEMLDAEFLKRQKQYKEPSPVDTADLPEIPETWCWVVMEEISEWVTDGTHQPPPFSKEGIPFLVISNMVNGKIEWDKVSKWVSPKTHEKYTGIYKPTRGDIIYSIVGSYGVAVEIITEKQFMFQRHIAQMRPLLPLLSATYLTFALNSPFMKSQADKVARGVAQKTINLSDLRRFLFPLAPLAEQNEIVKLLEKIFQRVEGERVVLRSSLEYLDTIDQAILAKAFRGELVPQDLKDEPAAVLLKRIAIEKEKAIRLTKKPRFHELEGSEKRVKQTKLKRSLIEVIHEYPKGITPEELLRAANYKIDEVDAFYAELSKICSQIEQEKPSGRSALKWPHDSKVILRLKRR